jgi:hypothetical protein
MKSRITLTIDPEVARRAKRIAHARRTNVSALVEDLVRNASLSASNSQVSFVDKWTGKLRLKKSDRSDTLLVALKKRYGLE